MKENRFECCFESEWKGIYFEVDERSSHIELTTYNNFQPETQVCLQNEDIIRLLEILRRMRR